MLDAVQSTTDTDFKESKNLPFTACVPSQVILDPSLNDAAKVTYALIATMLLRDGYATCSDQWLATNRKCSIDKIQESLKALEEAGYIYRQTWKEGMYSKRRIWRSDSYAKYLLENQLEDEKFKKCLRIGKSAYLEYGNSPTSSGQICLSNNKHYKDKHKNLCASRAREENKKVQKGGIPATFTKSNLVGEAIECNIDMFWHYCVKKKLDFSKEEVDVAWKELYAYNAPITNWQKCLVGFIEKNRREKSCGSRKNNSKRSSAISKKLTSEGNTEELHFQSSPTTPPNSPNLLLENLHLVNPAWAQLLQKNSEEPSFAAPQEPEKPTS